MEWFTATATLPGAKDVIYQDYPQKFVWEQETRKWKPRSKCYVIGRMYFVHPSAVEHFYLRTLLTTIQGAESWEDLRRYQGELHTSYKAACFACDLLEDDGDWKKNASKRLDICKLDINSVVSLLLSSCTVILPNLTSFGYSQSL